jgi:ribulose-phosphate 3-epimerase
MDIKLSPSIISADLAHLADCLAGVERAGVEYFHVDVADGHFVPNLMVGPDLARAVVQCVGVPVDCHLMIEEPLRYAPAFVEAGVERILIHGECVDDLPDAIRELHEMGVEAGVALKPRQNASFLSRVQGQIECLMAMTVEPGFSGQSFMEEGCQKIPLLREMFGPDIDIYVDGGLSPETAPTAVGYGANVIVAASAIFRADVPPGEATRHLRRAAEDALQARSQAENGE